MRKLRFLSLTPLALVGCLPGGFAGGSGGSSAGGEAGISSRCASADYGASLAARKVSSFLHASAEFTSAAGDLHSSLFNVCRSMGESLEMPSSELDGDLRAVCERVSTKMRSEFELASSESSVSFDLVATPPHCEVTMDAYAQCAAQCDVNVQPGELEMNCEGGEIVGRCDARCTGECAVEVQGQCRGECSGSCSGGCTGTCQGTCEGTCSSRGADGQCNGRCDGTCHGSCSAGCQGRCDGECWVSGQASCQGECRGGCSVEYREPRCTGHYRAPQVDADCQASCDAQVQAHAQCEPGQATLNVSGDVGNAAARIGRLQNAMRSFGELALIRARLQRLQDSGANLVETARGLDGVAEAGLQAIACVGEAAAAVPAAMASVSVSVDVSVSVSASASASVN